MDYSNLGLLSDNRSQDQLSSQRRSYFLSARSKALSTKKTLLQEFFRKDSSNPCKTIPDDITSGSECILIVRIH